MRTYEVVVVLRADLSDEDRSAQLDTIQNWIKAQQGTVVKVDHWGRRRLAYMINNQRDGYYALITTQLPTQAPPEIERNLRIAENILRFLVIREGD